jgi:hypothetical protein
MNHKNLSMTYSFIHINSPVSMTSATTYTLVLVSSI